MPELPEVETIRRQIDHALRDKTVERFELRHPDVWHSAPGSDDPALLDGAKLTSVDRRGKYLLAHFSPDLILIIHLRMTGQLLLKPLEAPLAPHTNASFYFPELRLDFRDVRRFGRLELSRVNEPWASKATLETLGPEPLTEAYTVAWLRGKAKRHQGLQSKAFLLNQQVIAGLGNIYVDEILHRSRIHPARPVRHLKTADFTRIREATQAIITQALELGGSSFSDYLHADGSQGSYIKVAAVYGRAGQPCLSCGTTLEKTRIAGRGTVYCPQCQKAPRSFKP